MRSLGRALFQHDCCLNKKRKLGHTERDIRLVHSEVTTMGGHREKVTICNPERPWKKAILDLTSSLQYCEKMYLLFRLFRSPSVWSFGMGALRTNIEVLCSYLGRVDGYGISGMHQSDIELFWYLSDSRDFVVLWTSRVEDTFRGIFQFLCGVQPHALDKCSFNLQAKISQFISIWYWWMNYSNVTENGTISLDHSESSLTAWGGFTKGPAGSGASHLAWSHP